MTERQRETETDRDRDRETQTHRHTETETHTEEHRPEQSKRGGQTDKQHAGQQEDRPTV